MSAMAKTAKLQRVDIDVGLIDPNPDNPNVMTKRAFDMLKRNIEEVGMVDPVFVRPKGKRFIVVGGHHRLLAAKELGFKKIPCTVVTDPAFNAEVADFQMVRLNMIKGKLDPAAFIKLYERFAKKYADEVLQESFGFADEREFRKIVAHVSKSLPNDLQEKFQEGVKEVHTIDGLSKLLNDLLTTHKDSLGYGFLIVEQLGKESVWLHASKDTIKAVKKIGLFCRENKRTVDDIIGGVLQLIAEGELNDAVSAIHAKTKEVDPKGLELPTVDNISKAA